MKKLSSLPKRFLLWLIRFYQSSIFFLLLSNLLSNFFFIF